MSSDPVYHIVSFTFKEGVSDSKKKEILDEFYNLRNSTKNGEKYIKAFYQGPQISIESIKSSHQYTSLVVFNSIEDRDYYVKYDQNHIDLAKKLIEVSTSADVFDFISRKD